MKKTDGIVSALFNAFAEYALYSGKLTDLQVAIMLQIAALRAMYSGPEYSLEVAAIFGGKDSDGKRIIGSLRTLLEAGKVPIGKPSGETESERDKTARQRLNKLLSDSRKIAERARDSRFNLNRSFNAAYLAAKGTGSNRSGTAKAAKGKAAKGKTAAPPVKEFASYVRKHGAQREYLLALLRECALLLRTCPDKLTVAAGHVDDVYNEVKAAQ